ncbi:MAG: hypothetical protein J0L69_12535 [Bacteroidetes bacterium]|nr:hypothetical protein [Bacteroidota bacterium]
MKHFLLSFCFLSCFMVFSQKSKITNHGNDTIEVINYHKNGRVKDSVWKTVEILVGKRESVDPKHPGDSIVMNIETPFGTQKKYYKSGRLKSLTIYGKNGLPNKTWDYRKKGSLAVYKETPYGLKKLYNKKGKQIRESDFNKGKYAKLPKTNKKHQHLAHSKYAGKTEKKTLILENGKKKLNIKPYALFSLQLHSDTTPLRHCVYEGVNEGKLVFSSYSYDLSESKNKLKLDSVFTLESSQVHTIYYACSNIRKKHFGAAFSERAGFSMMLVPPIGVTLIAGGYYLLHPVTLGVIAAGVPVFIISKALYKKTVPHAYRLNEWKIKL